jgi:Xaa-Pro aminopeptidase
MKADTIERLAALREQMKEKGIAAFLVNGSDPHMSEYVAKRWKTRDFISGFTGSYGWLAITLHEAALWTDSRYYLQAEHELDGTGITMLKARLPESIPTEKWVTERLNDGDTVCFDGSCYSMAEVTDFIATFKTRNINIDAETDLLHAIWHARPEIPDGKIMEHPVLYAGKTRHQKFSEIRQELKTQGCDMQILTALDDLAWTFNLRGNDVDFNPIAYAYGIVSTNEAVLFCDRKKINATLFETLKSEQIQVFDYQHIFIYLRQISDKKIWIDPHRTSYLIYKSVADKNIVLSRLSIPCKLKSIKNSAEIFGFRKAVLADGLALLDFQLWLTENIGEKRITEYDVALKLTECRSKQKGYRGDSFYPIVGYKAHGAIVHYSVTEADSLELQPEGMLLFDSGGQYEFGTTDITRTIALGKVTAQMKRDFTLVLKGMIALSSAKFITGTIGCHLDILARKAMWTNGLNYGHGTGHGIGAYLNVHEGPMGIRLDVNNQPILPGMVLSNEPALYREGEYGLRTENMILCVQDEINNFGNFSSFETLTLYPIDLNLLDTALLTVEEIEWINNYHEMVYEKLSPYTSNNQHNLLKTLVTPIE